MVEVDELVDKPHRILGQPIAEVEKTVLNVKDSRDDRLELTGATACRSSHGKSLIRPDES